MKYEVKLSEYEGPLDLLLSLIEKEELDITQISLAKITDQYLDYIANIEEPNAENLVDFMVLASQLLLMKSRALIPLLIPQEEDEELTTEELQRRLFELQRFRQAADRLRKIIGQKKILFPRNAHLEEQAGFYPPDNAAVKDIHHIFSEILGRLPQEDTLEKEIVREIVSIEDKFELIQTNINKVGKINFKQTTAESTKTEVIVTFLAMLELLKQRLVSVDQEDLFGEITIQAPN
ncbi:segregation and condensation protein A [Patescibacteria group bacterium]